MHKTYIQYIAYAENVQLYVTANHVYSPQALSYKILK